MEAVMTSSPGIVARARRLLFEPRDAWTELASAPPSVGATLRGWLLPWLLLGTAASFLGQWLFGFGIGAIRFRPGLFGGLQAALAGIVISLCVSFVIAGVASVLAPAFGGRRAFDRAFAWVAFGSAAALVANLASIIPSLWIVMVAGALYSLYLIYLGITPMLAVPLGRRLLFLLVLMLCGGVASFATVMVLGLLMNGLGVGSDPEATVTIRTPAGDVTQSHGELDKLGRRLEDASRAPAGDVTQSHGELDKLGRRLEDASRRIEQAQRSGDGPAIAESVGDAVKALTSIAPAGDRKPVPSQSLKEWLPQALGGLARTEFETNDGQALGIGGSMARATYGSGSRRLDVEVVDAGGAAGILAVIASLAQGERESSTETERSYSVGKRKVTEKHRKDGSYSEYTTILSNGVMVRAEAHGLGAATLDAAVKSLDLARLERP